MYNIANHWCIAQRALMLWLTGKLLCSNKIFYPVIMAFLRKGSLFLSSWRSLRVVIFLIWTVFTGRTYMELKFSMFWRICSVFIWI